MRFLSETSSLAETSSATMEAAHPIPQTSTSGPASAPADNTQSSVNASADDTELSIADPARFYKGEELEHFYKGDLNLESFVHGEMYRGLTLIRAGDRTGAMDIYFNLYNRQDLQNSVGPFYYDPDESDDGDGDSFIETDDLAFLCYRIAVCVDPKKHNPKIYARRCIDLFKRYSAITSLSDGDEKRTWKMECDCQEILDMTQEQLEHRWQIWQVAQWEGPEWESDVESEPEEEVKEKEKDPKTILYEEIENRVRLHYDGSFHAMIEHLEAKNRASDAKIRALEENKAILKEELAVMRSLLSTKIPLPQMQHPSNAQIDSDSEMD